MIIKHVRQVLATLEENHLSAKVSKCEFHKSEVDFLGHVISGYGVRTDPMSLLRNGLSFLMSRKYNLFWVFAIIIEGLS